MSTTPHLTAWIQGIGLIAPGLTDWPAARAVLTGEVEYAHAPSVLPPPALLPPAERRRASRLVKTSLAAGLEAVTHAGADAANLATVFTASGADGHNCHAICEQLAGDDRQISPTRFHNSVHNAAAGYWGIATGSMAPCQVLCAYDASFCAGLLDALAQVALSREPVLLIAYDGEYPEPIFSKRDTPDCGAIALLLTSERGDNALASIRVEPTRDVADTFSAAPLEALRTNIPALRGLPLLDRIARGDAGRVVLDYLPPMQLGVEVAPC